jgi:trimethylamine--corrinoid protein Co-methyltransferase
MARRRGRAAAQAGGAEAAIRSHAYRRLRHPFPPQRIWSDDEVAHLHDTALRVLEELGIVILCEEAVTLLAGAGARPADDGTLRIGRDIVEAALASAPRRWRLAARNPDRALDYAPGAMIFMAGGGCPNASDLERGRRPGTLRDFEETLKLQQAFDVIHAHSPSAEPQDVPIELRHYAMMRAQMLLGDKVPFVYARGRAQVAESFEMLQIGLDLSAEEWAGEAWCTTVINTNSPRQIDRPMAEGIIDFARAGQMSIVTPFCLAGAMAPVTVAGALVLQHAEALAAIALAQVARPGAPVSYGGFSSNVDMKSGAPAFGTPEHVRMQIGSGQLARHIGLPWRSASGTASNTTDMQAAQETTSSVWGALMANATLTVHAAGWLEGGLTFGYEKFINDIEVLQTVAELARPVPADADEIGWDALAEVPPGGHFFATAQTMARYRDAFYPPLVADLSNYGSWAEAGAVPSDRRATALWQAALAEVKPPAVAGAAAERLAPWIEARTRAGGAAPSE